MKTENLTTDTLAKFPDYDAHHKIIHVTDDDTGLNAFLAVHNANLGPALGGCRMVSYAAEADALRDVLRLSRGMTYKNALAGLPLGGGKSVIIGNPYMDKTAEMMTAMGKAVGSLEGLYITAEDSGTGEPDMEIMATQTSFVAGIPGAVGDLGGNPSPVTAYGVYAGMKAAIERRYGKSSFEGLTVAVQGLGAVGYELCRLLYDDGAALIATDIRPEVVEQAQRTFKGIKIVSSDDIFTAEAHVFAPCALGAQLNDNTVGLLNVDIVAGAANNQLATAKHEELLAQRNILYVPDYVVNAGGVIAVAYEYFQRVGRNPFSHELSRANMMNHVEGIGPTVTRIFNIADSRGILPGRAADEMAEAIFTGNETRREVAG